MCYSKVMRAGTGNNNFLFIWPYCKSWNWFDLLTHNFDDDFKDHIQQSVNNIWQLCQLPNVATAGSANCEIGMDELDLAFHQTNKGSCTGPDSITTIIFEKAGPTIHKYYVNILNASLCIGYFPKPWKKGNRIFIKKANKQIITLKRHTELSASPTSWQRYLKEFKWTEFLNLLSRPIPLKANQCLLIREERVNLKLFSIWYTIYMKQETWKRLEVFS